MEIQYDLMHCVDYGFHQTFIWGMEKENFY